MFFCFQTKSVSCGMEKFHYAKCMRKKTSTILFISVLNKPKIGAESMLPTPVIYPIRAMNASHAKATTKIKNMSTKIRFICAFIVQTLKIPSSYHDLYICKICICINVLFFFLITFKCICWCRV